MLDVTKLLAFSSRQFISGGEQSRKKMVEQIDQRRLAAKVEPQRFFFAACCYEGRSHFAKHIDVSTTKTVDRLFAIADDEKIGALARRCSQGEPFQQLALHIVGVLKFINQEEFV